MSDQPAEHGIGVLGAAQVAGTVRRVQAGYGQTGRVADVVQPRSGFQEFSVLAESSRSGLPQLETGGSNKFSARAAEARITRTADRALRNSSAQSSSSLDGSSAQFGCRWRSNCSRSRRSRASCSRRRRSRKSAFFRSSLASSPDLSIAKATAKAVIPTASTISPEWKVIARIEPRAQPSSATTRVTLLTGAHVMSDPAHRRACDVRRGKCSQLRQPSRRRRSGECISHGAHEGSRCIPYPHVGDYISCSYCDYLHICYSVYLDAAILPKRHVKSVTQVRLRTGRATTRRISGNSMYRRRTRRIII